MCNEADAEMLSPRHRQLAAVLWDLDGTLIDSRALWEIAYRDLAEQQGIQPSPDLWTQVIGHTLEDSVALLYTYAGLTADRSAVGHASSWLAARAQALLGRQPALLQWRPGACQALQTVQLAGIPTALVTTTWRTLTDQITAILSVRFDATVCGDEVACGKPAPDPYLRAITLLKTSPAGCVAVEDSPAGVAAAEAAGIAALAIPSHSAVAAGMRRAVRLSLMGLTIAELNALASSISEYDANSA